MFLTYSKTIFFFFNDTATTEIYTLSHTTLFRSRRRSRPRRTRPARGTRSRASGRPAFATSRSEEHTSELQSHHDLVCRLLLEKKKKNNKSPIKSHHRRKT